MALDPLIQQIIEKFDNSDSVKKTKQLIDLDELRAVAAGKNFDRRKAQAKAEQKVLEDLIRTEKAAESGEVSYKQTINQSAEATGKLAAALSAVDPRLGAIAQGLQKLEGVGAAAAGGAELLGTSLATAAAGMTAVAVAAVPAYLAWEQSTEDLAELDKWVKITTADLDAMEKGVGSIVEAQNELDKRQQKLRGSMTEAEAATYAEADAQKVYQGELAATGDALDHATERLKEMKRRAYDKSFFEFLGDSFNPFSQGLDDATRAIKQQEKEVERLKGNIKGLKGDQETYAGTLAKVTLEEERATGAKASRAKATADSNAALKAEIDLLLAAEKAEADHYAAIHKAVDALDKQAATARKASQSETERIEAERQAALEIADSIARTALMEARTADERRDIDRALAADRVAINQQADNAIQAKHDSLYAGLVSTARAAAKQEAAARATVRDAFIGQADAAAGAIASTFDAETAAGKAAAIAQIAIAEAQLLLAAAKYGPGAPAYIALGEIPIALAIAKLAGVGTDKAAAKADVSVNDSPYPMQAGPQGATIRIAPGDIAAIGRRRADIADQLGGGMGQGGSTTVNLQLNGRTVQAITSSADQHGRRRGRHQPTGTKRRYG